MQQVLRLLLGEVHVEVAVVFEPPLVGFRAERPDQSETARRVGEDADHPGTALDLLVEPIEEVRRLQVFVVLPR